MNHDERPELSGREKQLLKFAALGLTDTAIAHELGISEATVNTYWGRVRMKMGPYSRTELVAVAIREETESILIELRAQNEELVRRLNFEAGETPSGSSFYKEVMMSAADAMLLVDHKGVIEDVNASAAELFGYEESEMVGMPVSSLIPRRYHNIHDQHRAEFLANPEKRKMGEHQATLAVKKSGEEFSVAATLSAIQEGSWTTILCVVRAVDPWTR